MALGEWMTAQLTTNRMQCQVYLNIAEVRRKKTKGQATDDNNPYNNRGLLTL
ncbi:MAG: hypothetical protein SNJ29_11730 [Rikenellaceae bacterium]